MASSRRSTTRKRTFVNLAKYIKADSEDWIQWKFFDWVAVAKLKMPELDLFASIPNGAHKSHISSLKFKVTGLKKGMPDTFLPVARGGYHGLFIEFKSAKGRLSPEQKEVIAQLKAQNFLVEVCRDWENAAKITEDYLNLI